jgi:hypothetical protein
MKDRVARDLANEANVRAHEAYTKAMRVYAGVKTACYDHGCDTYSNAQQQVRGLDGRLDVQAEEVRKLKVLVYGLTARLDKKPKKVCKSCGQEKS